MSFSLRVSRRRGFTLIEILVVMGIIGILAALLFPVFKSARDGARSASCASNLRQISLGLQQYVQDNNGRYPSIGWLNGNINCSWADQIISYVKTPQVFTCPSALRDADYRPGCPPDGVDTDGKSLNYNGSYIQNWLRVGKEAFRPAGTRESRLVRPSSTMLVLEGNVGVGYIEPGALGGDEEPEPIRTLLQVNTMGVAIPGRHRGGNNVLFADGHIKWMRDQAMLDQSLWFVSAAAEPKITDDE